MTDDLVARLREAQEELGRFKVFAKDLSDALLAARPLGGSELFVHRFGEYWADPAYLKAAIQSDKEYHHKAMVIAVRERKAAEARVRELEAELAAMEARAISADLAVVKAAKVATAETIERCAKVMSTTVTGIEWQRFIINGVVCKDREDNDLFIGKSDVERLLDKRAAAIRKLAKEERHAKAE